jgi:hypothetical protein
MNTKRLSKAEQLIRDHFKALRVERRLKKSLDALCKKHPALEHRRPLLHFYTYPDGRKAFGRWVDDYDQIFPPSLDGIAPGNKKGREKFLELARDAQPEHLKKRAKAGIETADRLHSHAVAATQLAFLNLTKYTPQTAKEAGLLARHVIKTLPIDARGTVFGKFRAGSHYEEWKTRRHFAFCTLETVLRTFAKAAA